MPARLLTLLLIAYFAFPAAHAVGIGKVTLQSALGEPLHAQVDLQLGRGEVIEDSCLSLSVANDGTGNGIDYLALSALTLKLDQTKRKVEISSHKPFNEPFAIFRLNVKCTGMGSVSKTLTLLPEFGAAPAAQADAAAKNISGATPEPSVAGDTHPAPPPTTAVVAALPPAPETPPSVRPPAQRPDKPAGKHTARQRENNRLEFRLKLSGEPLDLSRIGKLSAAERELLLAQQKLLDEDDQTARFLAMQHQLKLMQEDMNAIRLKLAKLEAGASAVPEARAAANTDSTASVSRIWRGVLLALIFLAALALVWLVLRYIERFKAQSRTPEIPAAEPPVRPAAHPLNFATEVIPPHEPQADIALPGAMAEPASLPAIKEIPVNEEESAVLEEAELYAIHGHPDKAIRILHEFVAQRPSSEKAWVLLLSIYSSRGLSEEFESTARDFLRHHKNSKSWRMVQAQGRTLDQGNPLYVDENATGSYAAFTSALEQPHQRPIGDVLIELGYLSLQDMENCLKDFDPKRHGRFGNYLVTRRQISHTQLNEALLIQQTDETDTAAALTAPAADKFTPMEFLSNTDASAPEASPVAADTPLLLEFSTDVKHTHGEAQGS